MAVDRDIAKRPPTTSFPSVRAQSDKLLLDHFEAFRVIRSCMESMFASPREVACLPEIQRVAIAPAVVAVVADGFHAVLVASSKHRL